MYIKDLVVFGGEMSVKCNDVELLIIVIYERCNDDDKLELWESIWRR